MACTAAAVAAINLLEAGGPGGGGIVEKAVAAVTRGDVVYHVVQRSRGTTSSDGSAQTLYFESWHTTDGRMHQKVFAGHGTRRGKLLTEMAGRRRPGRSSGPALMYDPRKNVISQIGFGQAGDADAVPNIDPFADPSARLRDLQRRGKLRLAGSIRAGGRRAYRLVADSASWHGSDYERIEFLVDSETYLPLAQRMSVRVNSDLTYKLFTRFLVYERQPLDARSRALLDLAPAPRRHLRKPSGRAKARPKPWLPNPCPAPK